jgi:hypothetical protein
MSLRVVFLLAYDPKCDVYVAQGHSTEQTPGPVGDIEKLVRRIHTIHGKSWKALKDAIDVINEAGFSWMVKSARPGEASRT